MARLGTVGAVVLLVGLVLAGSGFVVQALVTQSEYNCQFNSSLNNCYQLERSDENTSIVSEFIISGGFIATGIGLFLVVLSMITIMARRERSTGPPPRLPPPGPGAGKNDVRPETPLAPSGGPPTSWAPPPSWDTPQPPP
jgi:hypothetical protein